MGWEVHKGGMGMGWDVSVGEDVNGEGWQWGGSLWRGHLWSRMAMGWEAHGEGVP